MARLPRLVHNRLSYLGAGIAGLALILFVFLFVLHSFTANESPRPVPSPGCHRRS